MWAPRQPTNRQESTAHAHDLRPRNAMQPTFFWEIVCRLLFCSAMFSFSNVSFESRKRMIRRIDVSSATSVCCCNGVIDAAIIHHYDFGYFYFLSPQDCFVSLCNFTFDKGKPATPNNESNPSFLNELSALSVRSLFQSAMPKVVRLSFLFTSSPLSPAMMTWMF